MRPAATAAARSSAASTCGAGATGIPPTRGTRETLSAYSTMPSIRLADLVRLPDGKLLAKFSACEPAIEPGAYDLVYDVELGLAALVPEEQEAEA